MIYSTSMIWEVDGLDREDVSYTKSTCPEQYIPVVHSLSTAKSK